MTVVAISTRLDSMNDNKADLYAYFFKLKIYWKEI